MPRHSITHICPRCHQTFHPLPGAVRIGGGKWCSRACRWGARSDEERFWTKVRKTETCWLWTSKKLPRGYGLFFNQGSHTLAHRYAYTHWVGPIPDDQMVCHHCDEPSCVRPDHLFTGTGSDNMRDAASKGRLTWGTEPGQRWRAAANTEGSKNGQAVLNEAAVLEIRRLWNNGDVTQVALGKQFGVTFQTINLIVNGKTWKHILDR